MPRQRQNARPVRMIESSWFRGCRRQIGDWAMSDASNWKLHWYQCAFGYGLVRFATVWSDKAVPSFRLGDDTFDLMTGPGEIALKQYVAGIGVESMTLFDEPVPDRN
jgi:hypothetical protein